MSRPANVNVSASGIEAMSPMQDPEEGIAGPQGVNGDVVGSGRRDIGIVDTMRAYRACLNCRTRKSKCDLDPHGGRPVS